MDETIAQVVTVTGSTPELAAQYVQLADGDAETAISLYFENGGADLAGSSEPATQPTQPQHLIKHQQQHLQQHHQHVLFFYDWPP